MPLLMVQQQDNEGRQPLQDSMTRSPVEGRRCHLLHRFPCVAQLRRLASCCITDIMHISSSSNIINCWHAVVLPLQQQQQENSRGTSQRRTFS